MPTLTTPYTSVDGNGSGLPPRTNAVDAALYAVLGLALGWLTMPALSIEAAELQRTQPEGLAIAASVGTAGTIGNTVIVPLFLVVQRYAPCSSERWVQIALALQALAVALAIVGAHGVIAGLSWPLYLVSFIGCLASNLQRLAAMPWVQASGLPTHYVSWLLAGGNATALVCALLGVVQQPGGADRFSVSIYFAALALLVGASAIAYLALAGRRATVPLPPTPPTPAHYKVGASVVPHASSPLHCGLPTFASHPTVLACILTNAIVQYICWIVMGFLLPFAAKHAATDGSGGVLLGYTAELSTVAVFLGSLVSTAVSNDALHCGATVSIMLGCLGVIGLLLRDSLPFAETQSARAAALLVAATLARFIDGLVTPLLYRRAGDPFPSQREAVTQFQGAVSIASTSVGTWLVLWLVRSGMIG